MFISKQSTDHHNIQNIKRPDENKQYFADGISKYIFLKNLYFDST